MGKSELVYIILYLLKKILTSVLILNKSVVNKVKNNYYYNISKGKDSYENKSATQYS